MQLLLSEDEGSENVAELVTAVCEALPDRADALELLAVFGPSFTPLLGTLLDAALAPPAEDGPAPSAPSDSSAPAPLLTACRRPPACKTSWESATRTPCCAGRK